jgi:cytochrome c oxidase subunit 2
VNTFTTGSPSPSDAPAEGSPTPRRWGRWAAGVAVLAPLALAGCNAYPTYGANRGATTQGQSVFKLYSGMMTTGVIVGGAVFLLILFTVFRYRRRSDAMPRQFHENLGIEIVYTGIPILIVAGLFVFTVLTENTVTATVPINATTTAAGAPVLDVTVTAFQWGWRFDYPGLDVGISGTTLNGPNNHGPQLVLPVGEKIQIKLVSNDVIHGFYVPAFNFQRQALPGVNNYFDFDIVRTGYFPGQCTEICGLYHAEMLFSVRSVSPGAFTAWAAAQRQVGHTVAGTPPVPNDNVPPPNTRITNSLPSPKG